MRPSGAGAPAQIERFRAISEAGARNAATALSQLLGRPVRLRVPWARAIPLARVADAAGGARRVVCAMWLRVYGEARGNLLLVFGQDQVRPLLGAVMGALGQDARGAPEAARTKRAGGRGNAAVRRGLRAGNATVRRGARAGSAAVRRGLRAGSAGARPGARAAAGDLDDLECSALREVGNILGAAYLNAVSHLLGLSLLPSIPGLSIDMAGAVTDVLLGEPPAADGTAMVLASQVLEPETGVRAEIFFLPDAASLPVLGRTRGAGPARGPAAP
jgi:chemotaxis protein CheY-P-specific phosphatase CheC